MILSESRATSRESIVDVLNVRLNEFGISVSTEIVSDDQNIINDQIHIVFVKFIINDLACLTIPLSDIESEIDRQSADVPLLDDDVVLRVVNNVVKGFGWAETELVRKMMKKEKNQNYGRLPKLQVKVDCR